jgi:hypothetical protein
MVSNLLDEFVRQPLGVGSNPIQELYNYFFSSGFIKPKKKGTKPKPTPQQMEQYYTVLNLRRQFLRKHIGNTSVATWKSHGLPMVQL